MKKVLVAMAMMMGVGSFSAFAAETSVDSVACCQSTQDEYTKIEVSEVPDAVKAAVEKAYEGQTIKEASVAEKDGTKTYKLVITSAEGTESTVIFNDKGEEVK
nr:hypothetical protein [Parabacteroides goldsteinii]